MAKQETLEFKGKVTELLPNAMFRVKLENNHEILAKISWLFSNFTLNIALGSNSVTFPLNSKVSCLAN